MLAVIRVRGRTGIRKEIEDTLQMLRLKRINHCVLVPETPEYLGMLKKAKDFITWGRINKETLVKLLKKRLRMLGDRKVDEESLKEITDFENFEDFADALMKGKVKLKDFKKLKPIFRLNPPRHGYKAIRLPYPKGDLGNRGEKINELIERML